MNAPASPPAESSFRLFDCLPWLVGVAAPLAALLAFLVQPLLAKQLLPIYGGTYATWLGASLYFQITVVLGYAWAATLVRRSATWQLAATLVVSLIALLTFRVPVSASGDPSILSVVWVLARNSLPAMVLLFSISPLLQGWLQRRGQPVPYAVYALSNAGSLAALLAYPFYLEPRLNIGEIGFYWHALFTLLCGVIAASGWLFWRQRDAEATADPVAHPEPNPATETTPLTHVALWLILSAATAATSLAATHHIAAEIGSHPLAWVGPLGAFLATFALTFAGRWQSWMTKLAVAFLALSLVGFMVAKGFTVQTVDAGRLGWLITTTAAACLVGHALLYSLRPATRFEQFYLIIALGGALGGLFSALIVPRLFPSPIEFPLLAGGILWIGLSWLADRRDPASLVVFAMVAFGPIAVIGYSQRDTTIGVEIENRRDLYGHLILRRDGVSVILSNSTTTHGTQLIETEESRHRPTLYYTESSGVGRAWERLQAQRKTMRIGVIGLGAGTLAAYARKTDIVDFWDIDPKALRVAREDFTYVGDSAGTIELHQADGRKALERSTDDYDLIVIDAFCGDGVPSHLLTREAFAIYQSRLSVRDGLLLIHASTRYSDLFPVVAGTARTLGLSTLAVNTEIMEPAEARDWDPTRTDYLVVCRPSELPGIIEWFPEKEDDDRVTRKLRVQRAAELSFRHIWTDSRNAAIDTLDLARYFSGQGAP